MRCCVYTYLTCAPGSREDAAGPRMLSVFFRREKAEREMRGDSREGLPARSRMGQLCEESLGLLERWASSSRSSCAACFVAASEEEDRVGRASERGRLFVAPGRLVRQVTEDGGPYERKIPRLYALRRASATTSRTACLGDRGKREKMLEITPSLVIPIFGGVPGFHALCPVPLCHRLCSFPARAAPSRPTRNFGARAATRSTARGRVRWHTGPRAGIRRPARGSRGRAATRTSRCSRARSLAFRA